MTLIITSGTVHALSPAEETLRGRVEALAVDPRVAAVTVADPWFLHRLYERREFNPLWSDRAKLDALLTALADSVRHGLDPGDYHVEELRRLRAEFEGSTGPRARAEIDLVATDAVARYAFHLHFGKVNPERLESSWNFSRSFAGRDPIRIIESLVRADDLPGVLDALAPQEARYRELRTSLDAHRGIEAAGGWPRVSAGETLRPGMRGPRVVELRRRLEADGSLAAFADPAGEVAGTGGEASSAEAAPDDTPRDEALYDDALESAVRAFQARHGLDVDAVVGPRSLAALNVPVTTRIDQLRVNLERVRWVFRDLEPRHMIANIARFRATLIEGGEAAWSTRAVVGRPYRQTPAFRARMTYLVFNPTWTVPPGILARDLLPEIRQDPGALIRRTMSVLDHSGRRVDPSTIDWAMIPARGFPYMLRQEPGPDNALGRVKFMFPNRHHVYMHDTPARDLFDHTERAFSSGCIRLENPLELARLLLAGSGGWDDAAIERTLRDGRERTVTLPRPLPVLLIYATAVPEDGEMLFLADIYNRDARLLEALDAEFEFSPPEGYLELLSVGR